MPEEDEKLDGFWRELRVEILPPYLSPEEADRRMEVDTEPLSEEQITAIIDSATRPPGKRTASDLDNMLDELSGIDPEEELTIGEYGSENRLSKGTINRTVAEVRRLQEINRVTRPLGETLLNLADIAFVPSSITRYVSKKFEDSDRITRLIMQGVSLIPETIRLGAEVVCVCYAAKNLPFIYTVF